MYDAIICLDEQKKMKEHLETAKLFGMRKTWWTKIPTERQKDGSVDPTHEMDFRRRGHAQHDKENKGSLIQKCHN